MTGELNMKHLSRALIAVVLVVLTATLLPVQVFADTPDYIGEVKVFMGDYKDAANEGFTILNGDDGKPVDINRDSGSTSIGAKGNKAVYFGYKTTKDRNAAITDLAVMNMCGGYDVSEYDALMDRQLSQQILPFIENFQCAIDEYRVNYVSENALNQKRAQYVHDALNKLIDDDSGKPLGDLLLNENVYELALKAYDKLTDAEKEQKENSFLKVYNRTRDGLSADKRKECADLATILVQSNGQAALMMESLITRAADDNDDTWFTRFEGTTYEDLENLVPGSPTDKMKALAKMFDDDARDILDMWDDFKTHLDDYDTAVIRLEEEKAMDLSKENEIVSNYDPMTATDEEIEAYVRAVEMIRKNAEVIANCENDILVHDYLEKVDYLDGTMLDFFTQDTDDVKDDITLLYPIVASLSKGQRAGLEFITLEDLLLIGITDEQGYKKAKFDEFESVSIYLGVNRELFQKGGVALTSDAIRSKVTEMDTPEKPIALAIFGGLAAGLALVGGLVFAATYSVRNMVLTRLNEYNQLIKELNEKLTGHVKSIVGLNRMIVDSDNLAGGSSAEAAERFNPLIEKHKEGIEAVKREIENETDTAFELRMAERSANCKYMMVGSAIFTVVMIALSATMLYLDYRAMKDYYNVKYTPIPHYMVEEKDLIGYNSKGEEIILNNQAAYYKAVECNRKKSAEYYKNVDTCADLNGDVGQQWLALYAVKNDLMNPILASSLKVVVGSSSVPNGYETGIHMFGEKAAFNLNDKRYCWNESAKSIMVYFKVDKAAPAVTGSGISGGTLALAAGFGFIAGAAIVLIAMTASKKRKDGKAATA